MIPADRKNKSPFGDAPPTGRALPSTPPSAPAAVAAAPARRSASDPGGARGSAALAGAGQTPKEGVRAVGIPWKTGEHFLLQSFPSDGWAADSFRHHSTSYCSRGAY
jgi:hypothetical protein